MTITTQDPAPGTLLGEGTYTVTITAEDESGNIGTCTFELIVDSTLGTNDPRFDISTIVMYPNPAKAVVNISNPQAIPLENANIYDVTGRLVKSFDLKGMGTEKALDIAMLASATYVVIIQSETGTITKQLIKE
ncbi:MAG: T9SS type A sorting domain-containing protein [Flavobacteriaceae bacterium]